MAVKIRLQRVGTKKRPFYRVVAVDSRKKRDGGVIEQLGRYQPIVDGTQFDINEDKVDQTAKEMRDMGYDCIGVTADITSKAAVEDMVAQTVDDRFEELVFQKIARDVIRGILVDWDP